eukprot:6175986-Pleurochrysis_carterae.AAC.2
MSELCIGFRRLSESIEAALVTNCTNPASGAVATTCTVPEQCTHACNKLQRAKTVICTLPTSCTVSELSPQPAAEGQPQTLSQRPTARISALLRRCAPRCFKPNCAVPHDPAIRLNAATQGTLETLQRTWRMGRCGEQARGGESSGVLEKALRLKHAAENEATP